MNAPLEIFGIKSVALPDSYLTRKLEHVIMRKTLTDAITLIEANGTSQAKEKFTRLTWLKIHRESMNRVYVTHFDDKTF